MGNTSDAIIQECDEIIEQQARQRRLLRTWHVSLRQPLRQQGWGISESHSSSGATISNEVHSLLRCHWRFSHKDDENIDEMLRDDTLPIKDAIKDHINHYLADYCFGDNGDAFRWECTRISDLHVYLTSNMTTRLTSEELSLMVLGQLPNRYEIYNIIQHHLDLLRKDS